MSDDGSNPTDSAADLFSEGLRSWAAAWDRMARDATGFSMPEDFASPWLRALSSLAGSTSRQDSTGSSSDGQQDLMTPLAKLYLDGLGSSLRYYGRAAEAWSRYVEKLARRLTDLSDEDLSDDGARLLVDEARAALREISDFSMQEARLLGEETERLSSKLQELLGQQPAGKTSRRFARAKGPDG